MAEFLQALDPTKLVLAETVGSQRQSVHPQRWSNCRPGHVLPHKPIQSTALQSRGCHFYLVLVPPVQPLR